jgi:hypothetical protein
MTFEFIFNEAIRVFDNMRNRCYYAIYNAMKGNSRKDPAPKRAGTARGNPERSSR